MQVNVVMLNRPPEPLDEDIILASASAVHADSVVFKNLGKGPLLFSFSDKKNVSFLL